MEAVSGRDKPHSQARLATAAIGLGLVAAAVLVATSPLPAATTSPPPWWTSAEVPAVVAGAGWPWDALALLLPVGERGVRGDLLALLLVLAVAAAAGRLVDRLYRGTGRTAATTVALPLTAALLVAWLHGRGGALAPAIPGLAFALLTTLGLAAVAGSRVHGHGVGPAAWVRGGGAALAAALVWPVGGAGFAAGLLAYAAWHRRADGGRGWRDLGLAALAAAPGAALMIWSLGHGAEDMSCATCSSGQSFADTLVALGRIAGPALQGPALALLVLVVAPLRWRGGGLVLAGAAGAVAVGCVPAALVAVAVAACGWIWLAGGLRQWWLARGVVAAASLAVLVLAAGVAGPRVVAPVAARRPEHAMIAVIQRGLVAPGDVLLGHDPWLVAAFAAVQRDEGVRPDVVLVAAADVEPERLGERLEAWRREGRRVLSDSFSYAGRWQAAWVLDSGPLFWLIGGADLGERSFTDIHAYTPDLEDPDLGADERVRWERLHLERVRHRRALGRHDAAAVALPLDEDGRAEVAQRVHLAELSRLPAALGSELGPAAWASAPPSASSLGEAGDLLFALGDGEAGAGFLERAAGRGATEAFGALARWYLRAGEEVAARETLAVMTDPSLRPQLIAVCRWLLARARVERAALLLADVAPAPGFAPEELGTRLAVLRGLATPAE